MAAFANRLQKRPMTPDTISPQGRNLLENYAGISPEQLEEHVLSVRDRAWEVWPYVCIGEIRFMDLYMSRFPEYPSILKRLKKEKGETLLDLGCCFGQELRKLVFDGAPLESVYGAELRPEFLKLSFELFRDEQMFNPRLVIGDIFDIPHTGLAGLVGKIDIVYASAFIHLFDWDSQVECCIGIVNLLKSRKGSLVFGRQAGRSEAGPVRNLRSQDKHKAVYMHSPMTFMRLWEIVGEKTGSKWKVNVTLSPNQDTESHKYTAGHGRLYFATVRQ